MPNQAATTSAPTKPSSPGTVTPPVTAMRNLPAAWVAGTVMLNGAVPTDEAIVYAGGDADTGPEVEIVIRGPDALRISGLIAAAPDMLAVAKMPLVHQIEESEGIIRLSIGGVELCAHPDGTPQAVALLQFDAQQRAAIAKAEG